MSPTPQCIWGDSLGSAAAAVVWVVFPDFRLCPDSCQFGDQNSPESVLAFGVPVAVPLIFGELLENRATVGVVRVTIVAVCAGCVAGPY